MTNGFHEVRFPLRLSLGASGGPGRRTDIVALSNGGETRNARWADARRRYDAGTGLRGLEDLYQLTRSSRRGAASFTGSASAIRSIMPRPRRGRRSLPSTSRSGWETG
jgi:uncharacterized protein (TIGR02217 family)